LAYNRWAFSSLAGRLTFLAHNWYADIPVFIQGDGRRSFALHVKGV
jgi:hypothetical protein